MKRNLTVFSGVVLVLVGMAFVMPAVAQMQRAGALPNFGVGLLLLGIALTLGGVGAVYTAFRRRWA